MKLQLIHKETPVEIEVASDGESLRLRLPDGQEKLVTARRLPGGVVEVKDGGRVFRVPVVATRGGVSLWWQGQSFDFERATPGAETRGRHGAASGVVVAPMTGVVAAVLVEVGQDVEAYQPLATLEAMKVLATVTAPFAGRVQMVAAVPGKQVQQGEMLAEIAPKSAPEAEERSAG